MDNVDLETKLARLRIFAEKDNTMPSTIELLAGDLKENEDLTKEQKKELSEILKKTYRKAIPNYLKLAKREARKANVMAVKLLINSLQNYIALGGVRMAKYEKGILKIKLVCYKRAIEQSEEKMNKYQNTDKILAVLMEDHIGEYRLEHERILKELKVVTRL